MKLLYQILRENGLSVQFLEHVRHILEEEDTYLLVVSLQNGECRNRRCDAGRPITTSNLSNRTERSPVIGGTIIERGGH